MKSKGHSLAAPHLYQYAAVINQLVAEFKDATETRSTQMRQACFQLQHEAYDQVTVEQRYQVIAFFQCHQYLNEGQDDFLLVRQTKQVLELRQLLTNLIRERFGWEKISRQAASETSRATAGRVGTEPS